MDLELLLKNILRGKPEHFEVKALPMTLNSEALDAREVVGYGSTWALDDGLDIIEKGAFEDTIAERFDAPMRSKGSSDIRIFYQHRSDWPIGPLLQIEERDVGLWVRYKLSKVPKGDEAYVLLQDKAIDSMSIGYIVDEASFDDKTGIRNIKKATLFEISPVSIPMNRGAVVTAVKCLGGDIKGGMETLKKKLSPGEWLWLARQLGMEKAHLGKEGDMDKLSQKIFAVSAEYKTALDKKLEGLDGAKAGNVLRTELQSELGNAISALGKIAVACGMMPDPNCEDPNKKDELATDPTPKMDPATSATGDVSRCAACNNPLNSDGICTDCAKPMKAAVTDCNNVTSEEVISEEIKAALVELQGNLLTALRGVGEKMTEKETA